LTRPLAKVASTRQRLRDGLPSLTGKLTLREFAVRQELVKFPEKAMADCIFKAVSAAGLDGDCECFIRVHVLLLVRAIDRELMGR